MVHNILKNKRGYMAERKNFDAGLVRIGNLLATKRKALWPLYKTREKFIELRSIELFDGKDWISPRHLANLELGKNWISIEKLLILATALEENPVDLFIEIIEAYKKAWLWGTTSSVRHYRLYVYKKRSFNFNQYIVFTKCYSRHL